MIAVVLVRQQIERLRASVRWVPSALQLADGLTKDAASGADTLRAVMASGMYTIGREEEALQKRAEAKEERVVDRAQGALRDAAAIARAERRAFCSVVFEDIHGNFRFKRAPRVSLCG